jgi:2',3'-cyclic-nucleotide 2'-phosphodiesterase (5'-nucleotidase family)
MTHYLTGETITYQINSTSTTVYRYNKIYTTSVTAKNLQFSYTRSGNTVRVQCSGDAINTALNAWDDIISIPDGYNPKIGSGQDSIWVFSKLGNAVQDFQIINKIIRSPYAIASGTFIRFAATWITDQSFPS